MTIDEVKEYLNQVRNADKMIDLKQKRLDELNAQKTNIGSQDFSRERVCTSPSGDTLSRIVDKIVDLQKEINADIDRFIDLKAAIMRKIDLIHNADEQSVLYDKYFLYKTIQQIADDTPCCTRTVKRLHKKALEDLAIILSP